MMKSFLRFLWRNRLYTAIEVLGMAVAMAFVIFIASFVIGELSYDKGLEGTENIYAGHSERLFIGSATIKGQVEGKFPEIESICRMTSTSIFGGLSCYARVGDEEFRQNALIADENFFGMFSFPLVSGTPESALSTMNSVAVSESFARKYFKEKDPCGQTFLLMLNGKEEPVTINAVYRDFSNTIFPAQDIIYRFDLFEKMYPDGTGNGSGIAVNFYKVTPGTDIASLENRIEEVVKANDYIYLYDVVHEYRLSPFKDIHFGILDESAPFEGVVKKDFIRLFIAAGVLLRRPESAPHKCLHRADSPAVGAGDDSHEYVLCPPACQRDCHQESDGMQPWQNLRRHGRRFPVCCMHRSRHRYTMQLLYHREMA